MKRFQLVTTAVIIMILMLACATIGLGGDENNNVENQNQSNMQNSNNSQENQTITENDSNADASMGEDQKDNNDESDSTSSDSGEADGSLWNTAFGQLLESGNLVMESNESNSDGETVGPILTVQFTNPSNDEILVSLPCGLVFVPTETDEQALMMVQPLEVSLPVGESAEFTPFVVCIDMGAPAPAQNSGYTIGYLAEEDLLAFAECLCGQEINTALGSMDSMGVQFAAWSIATGGDVMSLVGEEGAAYEEFLEGMELGEFADMMTDMFSTFGGEWLDRCGITVGEQ